MENTDMKAIGRGALYIVSLILLSIFLAHSVTHKFWINAQICLLAILALLSIAAWHIRRLLLGRPSQKTSEPAPPEDRGVATIVKLLQFTAFGVAAVIVYAIRYDDWITGTVAKTIGVGLLTAGASLAAGALLGFLFGVPKSQSTPPANSKETTDTGSAPTGTGQFGANTNLEQISDWLTKTIVGVSLVELSKLPPILNRLATYVAAGMSDPTPHSKAVVLVILVYFVSAGFLTSYLWTRMELTRAFNDSALSKRVSDLEKQSEIDANAIASIDRWLNHHPAQQDEDKSRTDMMNAIKAASSLVKARVFVTADDYKRNVTTAKIREASDFTLPIFQTLVEADGEGIFHRNRGQYAFCLMTQSNPDWSKALTTLQEAMKIRDGSKDPGWPEYEFARAICKMKLDPQAKTNADARSAIDADLKKADDLKLDQAKRDRLDLDGDVPKWRAAS